MQVGDSRRHGWWLRYHCRDCFGGIHQLRHRRRAADFGVRDGRPGALAFSKLFYPETEESKTTINDVKLEKGEEANILDAAAQGASNAIMLVMNIGASLIAFLAFVGFLNAIIGKKTVKTTWSTDDMDPISVLL